MSGGREEILTARKVMAVVPASKPEFAASESSARLPVARAAETLAATRNNVTMRENRAALLARLEWGLGAG